MVCLHRWQVGYYCGHWRGKVYCFQIFAVRMDIVLCSRQTGLACLYVCSCTSSVALSEYVCTSGVNSTHRQTN